MNNFLIQDYILYIQLSTKKVITTINHQLTQKAFYWKVLWHYMEEGINFDRGEGFLEACVKVASFQLNSKESLGQVNMATMQ